MQVKRWYESKIIGVGAAAILGAVADGIQSGFGWRQIVVGCIGALVVVLRAWYTDKAVTK